MVLTTIRLSRPGLSPPVYLAGTFTQWEPTIEMDHDAIFGSGDQHEFSKAVDIEAGEHQFKFRLGHGDWWIVDEETPTVPDGFGNANNVIHVFEQTEPETKVVEVNEQSLPVKEVKPAPEVQSTKDTLAPEVPAKEKKPTPQVPVVEEHKPAPAVPVQEVKSVPEVPIVANASVPEVPVKEDLPAPEVPVKEVKATPEVPVAENKYVQPEVSVSEDKPVPEAASTKDTLTPVVPLEKAKAVSKAPVEEQQPIQPGIPVKEDKPTPEVPVKEVKPIQEAPSTKETSTPEILIKEAKPVPKTPFEEQKPAQPEVSVKEDKTPRTVPSKDTFAASIKTTTSELTAVVNQETSSIQSILRPSIDDNEAPSRQEPQTPKQKSQGQTDGTNGVPNYGAIPTEEQKSVKKGSTESFIKRIFSCFSGKTAFGMAAVSAVLVAVIIRR